IEFLGRLDDQVKIRGYRIELGDIETQLSFHDAVKEVAVLAKDINGDRQLVAYYTSNKEIDQMILKRFLLQRLPEFMVPSYYVHLTSLPLTVNGKLNRKALPQPDVKVDHRFESPSNVIQDKLVDIWSEVLNLDRSKISIHANFFDLGGHSLKIIEINRLVNEHFSCNVSVGELFGLPTIVALSAFILDGTTKTDAKDMLEERDHALALLHERIN